MKYTFLFVAILFFAFTSCNDENDFGNMTLKTYNLADLGDDYVYEGWVIVDGAPVSTGTFTVGSDGKQSQYFFNVNEEYLTQATSFVLSVEPANDTDPAPSAIKLLSGDFANHQASLNTESLVGDFSAISGGFIVATPTSDAGADFADDDDQGVWFINSGSAGLVLPELADGWVYEGWVVWNGTPLSTGIFTSPTGADMTSPLAVSYNGPVAPPAFPGEDFLTNQPDGIDFTQGVGGLPVVISIEPADDTDPAPFQLKPLTATVDENPSIGVFMDMTDNSSSFPTGTVSF